jgi:hypothetical protein
MQGKWVKLVHDLALLPDTAVWTRVGRFGGRGEGPVRSLRRALGDQFFFASRAGVIYAKRRR